MRTIEREKLIRVCSELLGEKLAVVGKGHDKHMKLVSAQTGSIKNSFPKSHGERHGNQIPIATAFDIIREISKGDVIMYEKGKRLLRGFSI